MRIDADKIRELRVRTNNGITYVFGETSDERKIAKIIDEEGEKWFIFAVCDCDCDCDCDCAWPIFDLVSGRNFEDAYEQYIDFAAEHRHIAIEDCDEKDYLDEYTGSFTSNGKKVDTENIQGFEVQIVEIKPVSAESWIDEFYPEPASECPIEMALDHSLQKWIGLRKENLEKHGLTEPPIKIRCSTCALCQHYWPYCQHCPLDKITNNRCDKEFDKWECEDNPEPMIELIQLAISKGLGV